MWKAIFRPPGQQQNTADSLKDPTLYHNVLVTLLNQGLTLTSIHM